MKTPVLESLYNKVAGLKACVLLKRNSNAVAFLRILPKFQEKLFLKNQNHILTFFGFV